MNDQLLKSRSSPFDYKNYFQNRKVLSVEDLIQGIPGTEGVTVCPPGELFNCCRDLKEAKNDLKTLVKLVDNSGTERVSGLRLGHKSSDGKYLNCKRDGFNYCRYTHNNSNPENDPFVNPTDRWVFGKKTHHCVPKSCNVTSLNAYMKITGNPGNIPDESTGHYTKCFDPALWTAKYEWYEIFGYVMFGLWALFLLFSPIKILNLRTIIKDLMDTNQPESTLKTLNGIRVISLFWVMLGHAFLYAIWLTPNNRNEVTFFVMESPSFIWLTNATFSVDNFFVIGGFLTGYLLKRAAVKAGGKIDFKMLFLAILNRSLRLIPTIGAAILVSMLFYRHTGGSTIPFNTYMPQPVTWLTSRASAETYKDGAWAKVLFNFIWLDYSVGYFGHLWYVSCDYWYFIIGACILMLLVDTTNKKRQKTGLIITAILSVLSLIYATAMNFLTQQEFAATQYITRHPNLTNPYPDSIWAETYFRPWTRITPYLTGIVAGCWLAELRLSKVGGPGKWTWKVNAGIILSFLMLVGLMFFPYPNFTLEGEDDLFWPYWVGVCYTSLSRGVWGLILTYFVYLLEKHKTGMIYDILSSNFWVVLSKLNFSAYLFHIYIICRSLEFFGYESFYFSEFFTFLWSTGCVVTVYVKSAVFYILCEYPLTVGCKFLMGRLQGMGAKAK